MARKIGLNLGAIALGAVAAASITGAAYAGDGFSGDASVSYNSHFISYGADVWGGGSKLFASGYSPTFVNADLYYTKGSLTLTGNVWFDLLGGDKIGNSNPLGGSIQEVDLNLGASYAIGAVTVGATYGFWNYGGDTESVLDLSAAYNDADLLIKGFALNPKVVAHIRTDRGAGQTDTGAAIVVSLAPSFALGPVSASIPVGAAFFTDKGFQGGTESGYAYSYAGLSLGLPLSFIPSTYGTWTVFTDWIGYFTEKDAIPFNKTENFLTADVGIKLAF